MLYVNQRILYNHPVHVMTAVMYDLKLHNMSPMCSLSFRISWRGFPPDPRRSFEWTGHVPVGSLIHWFIFIKYVYKLHRAMLMTRVLCWRRSHIEAVVGLISLRSVVGECRKCIFVAVDLGIQLHTKTVQCTSYNALLFAPPNGTVPHILWRLLVDLCLFKQLETGLHSHACIWIEIKGNVGQRHLMRKLQALMTRDPMIEIQYQYVVIRIRRLCLLCSLPTGA